MDSDIVKFGSFDRKIYRDQNLIIFVDKTKNVYPKDDFIILKVLLVILRTLDIRHMRLMIDLYNMPLYGIMDVHVFNSVQYNPNKLSVLSQAYFDKMHL